MSRIVIGFDSDGQFADPAAQGLVPTSSYTVEPGETVTETEPDGTTHTYTATEE